MQDQIKGPNVLALDRIQKVFMALTPAGPRL